ncbi:LacI family DNA-binding transcriptional regulator [Nesterenkonia massiliensis]|uniref:LacI family DNA-binding transcriptional regulator n=1 Tax=Nesterenkonia massiliensis TaxID=1232429 RepID=UPI0005C87AA2|nr:LacI family DNA-binding transcriptional regulator [Nesterenkonia massiliensis]
MAPRKRTGRSKGSATIAQVAGEVGVSPATVSRVMNNRFVGADEVAERVRSAAAKLNYAPSYTARSLALGQTQAVAFVAPDLRNPAFQAMLSGLSATANEDGYRVLIGDSAESALEEPMLAGDIRRRTDALVLCAPRMAEEQLASLSGSLHPMVLINRKASSAAPSLTVDYRAGIEGLLGHLYELGHRRVAYVEGTSQSVSNQYRLQGVEAFTAAHPDLEVLRIPGGVASQHGFEAADRLMETGATAAMAYNDLVAIGLLGRLQERGVRVPDDISVTGFDDIPFARYIAPALTTASVPHEELGVQAWYRLRSLIEGKEPGHDMVFQPRLEVRASTGAPKRDTTHPVSGFLA